MDLDALRQKMRARMPRATASRRWYDIRNQDGDVATIRIYDEISWWGISADDFANELERVTAPKIEVQINSPGGDVWDGIAIFNALRSHPAHVTTRVDGMAASVASIIVQAGDERVMLSASQMVIHDAWGLAIGSAQEMRDFADILDRQSEILADIYAQRSDKSADDIRELMRAETWFKDQEAVDAGLADQVVTPSKDTNAEIVVPVRAELDPALAAFLERMERVAARFPEIPDLEPEAGPVDSDAESFLRAVLAPLSQGEQQ